MSGWDTMDNGAGGQQWTDAATTGDDAWTSQADKFADDFAQTSFLVSEDAAHDSGVDTGAGFACHNCGNEGHKSRECPEPRKLTGECYNCGEIGHNKADCPNPRVERPFTGSCRICEQEGHRAAECPEKPAETCRKCGQSGHLVKECSELRALDFSSIPDVSEQEAMKLFRQANADRDVDLFRNAVKALAKSNRDLTYYDIQQKLHAAGLNLYIVGLAIRLSKAFTNVNLQGKDDQKYTIAYLFSLKPRRLRAIDDYPSSFEDNLERLKQAGDVMNCLLPLCTRCDELGHISKNCPVDRMPPDAESTVCSNCGEIGHYPRDCTQARKTRGSKEIECRRCNETGHFAKDCPRGDEAGSGPRTCRNCGSEEHIAKDCDQPRDPSTMTCRNCDEVGHMSRECPKPRDYSRVKCNQCGEMGHTIARCKAPPNTAEDGTGEFDDGTNERFDAVPEAATGDWNNNADSGAPSGW